MNAKMIEDLGLAVVLEQKDLNKETLLSAIEKAFSIDKESIEKVSARIENVTFPDAEKRIVEEVMKEINIED
jgi:UDP-N-acetylglucosamine:LPS N-acetylglucosamine transferase